MIDNNESNAKVDTDKKSDEGGGDIVFHEIGLLSNFEVKEIRKENAKFNDMKKQCNFLPSVKPFDINNDRFSESESPEKATVPTTILIPDKVKIPHKDLFGSQPDTSGVIPQDVVDSGIGKKGDDKIIIEEAIQQKKLRIQIIMKPMIRKEVMTTVPS